MKSKQPLATRLVIAFVLMTVIVGGVFSLGIVAVVHSIEERLVSEELQRQLETVVAQDLPNGRAPRLDSATQFYALGSEQYPVPKQVRKQPTGFSELVLNEDEAYYIYSQEIDGQRYFLQQEQNEFEERERILFRVVLGGFLLSVMAAWLLGLIMARKVISPVERLARQVLHRDQLNLLAPSLAPDYADDEIGQLALAFDSTLGKLRMALEREKLFTSDVSHELRTPLMVISTSCELLREQDLPPAQAKQIERIQRASSEMQGLVQTFLQLARNKSNPSATKTATLQQVSHELYEHWESSFQRKGLNLQRLEQGVSAHIFDDTLLRTVMSNLLRNALHYTEQGTVQLIVRADGFSVADSGDGIPSEQRDTLFEPFVRGPKARGEGLGLGLSLVKRICESQGWQIEIKESELGGAEFRVHFHYST